MTFKTMIVKPIAHRPIKKIGGLVSHLLVPGFMVRLDHYLLMHYPLVWRTKVHYLAWFSLILANALLFGLGAFISLETSNIPTLQQVDNWVAAIRLIGSMLLLGWGYTQFRSPMTESPIRLYLMTGLIYYICIFSVMLNPLALVAPVAYRIAELVPDAEFQLEYSFHEQNHFWCCHPKVNKEAAELNRQRIIDSLGRYGFQKSFEFSETNYSSSVPDGTYCSSSSRDFGIGNLPCLAFQTKSGAYNPLLFRDRLVSLHEAKRLKQSEGYYYENIIGAWPAWSKVSMASAWLLFAAVYPVSAIRRQFELEHGLILFSKLHLPQPGFLSQLDRFLRIRHPLVWSTRIHTFPFNFPVYGSLAILSIITLWLKVFPEMDFNGLLRISESNGFVISLGVLLSLGWLCHQTKIPLKVMSTSDNLRALLLYIFTQLTFLILLLGSMSIFGRIRFSVFNVDFVVICAIFLFGCPFFTAIVFLQKFISRWMDILLPIFCSLLFFTVFLVFVVASHYTYFVNIVMIGIWAIFGLFLWLNHKKTASKLVGRVAIFYVLTTAFSITYIAVLIAGFFNLRMEMVFLCASYLNIPFFLLAIVPIIPILVRYRYQPKD